MACMPYDSGNAQYENPQIVVSHDFYNWQAPAGIGNPVILPPSAVDNNYDVFLTMLEDGVTMAIVCPQTYGSVSGCFLQYTTSTDGVHWSAPVAMQSTRFATNVHYWQTPCPIYDPVLKQWTMYAIDFGTGSGVAVYATSTGGLAGPWSAPSNLTVNLPPGETQVWHWDLRRTSGGNVVGMAMCGTSAGGRVYPVRIPANASGGLGTVVQFGPILRANNFTSASTYLYRCSFVPFADHWKCMFGMFGVGGINYAFSPGICKFDRTYWTAAINGSKAANMPNGQFTGTLASPAVGSNLLAWDSFNHATFGNVTASGNGSASAWSSISGTNFAISANLLAWGGTGGHYVIASGQADVDIRATYPSTPSGSSYVTFRVQNSSNFWRCYVTGGAIYLQSVVAGNATTVAQPIVTTSESNSELWIQCKGNSIKVFWQGLLMIELNSAIGNTQTQHGLQLNDATTISNFVVSKA